MDKLNEMYKDITNNLPSTELTLSVEEMAQRTLGLNSTEYVSGKVQRVIIDGEMELYLSNEDINKDWINRNPSLAYDGRRMVTLRMEHKRYRDMLAEIAMNNPELGFSLIPLFSIIGKGLDSYLGMVGAEYDYDLTSGLPLFEMDYSGSEPPPEGEVPQEIRDAFSSHGYMLSESAQIQVMEAVSKTKCIVDHGRVYKPKRWSPSGSLTITDKTKEYTLWGIDYIDEILKSPAWYFYMDSQLVNEIGHNVISPWADTIVKRDDHGYFITQYLSENPEVSKWEETKAFYNERIRPIIIQRLRTEYSKIGLSHQERWDRSRYVNHPLASR